GLYFWPPCGAGIGETQGVACALWDSSALYRRLGAYRRHLELKFHVVGTQRTQQLERKHLAVRMRIKRLVREPFAPLNSFRCMKQSWGCSSTDSISACRFKLTQ